MLTRTRAAVGAVSARIRGAGQAKSGGGDGAPGRCRRSVGHGDAFLLLLHP